VLVDGSGSADSLRRLYHTRGKRCLGDLMSDKFLECLPFEVSRPTLDDLKKYIPIIEHAVLGNDPIMKRQLVITSDQLKFEQRVGRQGTERLNVLIDGIRTSNPFNYRDRYQQDARTPRPWVVSNFHLVDRIFRYFLNWLNRSGYRYVQNPVDLKEHFKSSDNAGNPAAQAWNDLIGGGASANVLYNPIESSGNCDNVANGFALALICLGVPVSALKKVYIWPQSGTTASLFAYVGAKASRSGAVFYQTAVRNRHEYRSRVMTADREDFVAVPSSEIDNPFGNHWVVKAHGTMWDGNYACRYDEPSEVCEAYSSVKLQGKFIGDSLSFIEPLGKSVGNFVEVKEANATFATEIKRVTGHNDGQAYILVKPGDPWCQVVIPSSEGRKTVPLRLAREAGYVVPDNWSTDPVSQAFVKNAVATAIVKYRDDTSFWNSKSAETDGFLKSAVRWIGEDDGRCKSVKAKFFAKDDLTKVPKLPEHSSYRDLYHVLGFDPTGEQAVPKSVVGKRLRGFLLNAFKVPEHIKAAAGA
jgi:hypothetical protein